MNERIEPSKFGGKLARKSTSLLDMLWHKRSKWAKLSLIMVLLVVVSVISSLIARTALFETTYQSDYKIAVIAPMTGKLSATGQAMRNGAELYARAINDAGGIEGQYIGVEVFDNKGEETATIDQTRKHWQITASSALLARGRRKMLQRSPNWRMKLTSL